ncbi:hypothetical protein B0H21DRAFT_696067 [Amylocystis lapponica]|nr:hypothetical protein B0H21DRAFT_701145 [Amylocystis lapponica]KAH9942773.1 hypothetical protein B0H21DRAFT_696067 [Amylocystis lapponica]
MTVRTTPAAHTLDVHLPHADQCRLMPEMVTVAARQGARLRVVVDYWALERDAHFEWEVAFVHADVDLSAVRAVLAPDGHLAIRVRRCVGAPARRDVVPVVWSPYA